MADYIKEIISDIEGYLLRTGMSASYFGKKAINTSDLVERLRAGGRVWPETAERIRTFMSDNPPETVRHRRKRKAVAADSAKITKKENEHANI